MKFLISFFIMIFVAVLTEAEVGSGKPEKSALSARATVRLDDQTIYKTTADLADYERVRNLTGHIRSIGAPSFVSHWSEEFKKIYPEVTFDIQIKGHKPGLEMLLQGQTDLVPIARRLRDKEIAQFKKQFGYEPTLVGVAFDALGVYVNKNNPIEQITLQQLDAIFSHDLHRGGKAAETWGDLGVTGALSNNRILRFSLATRVGIGSFFRKVVMLDGHYRLDIQRERTSGSLVQSVGANDAGISFTRIFYATHRTKFAAIVTDDGKVSLPTYMNVVTGQYPLSLTQYFVINKKPNEALSPALLEFLRFVTSQTGQRIIALVGGYPLTPERQEESRSQFE
jgi:phosphate transport system substrate-binding protein